MTNYEAMILQSRAVEMEITAKVESNIMSLLLKEHKRISIILDDLSYPSELMKITQLQAAQQRIERVMDDLYGKTGFWKGRRVAVGGELEALMVDAMEKASQAAIDGKVKAGIAFLNDVNPNLIPELPRLFGGIHEDVIQKLMIRPLSDDRIFSQRLWKLKSLTDNLISQTLTSGMLEGKSAVQIAKDLRQFLILQGEGRAVKHGMAIKQPWNTKKIISRTMTLARTEINNAFTESQIECAKREPWNRGIKWNLSASHKVYDICDVYATQDLYKLGPGVYPPDKVPVRHPNCWCFLTDVLKSIEEVIGMLKEDLKIPEREVIRVKEAVPKSTKFRSSTKSAEVLRKEAEQFEDILDINNYKENKMATKSRIATQLHEKLQTNNDFCDGLKNDLEYKKNINALLRYNKVVLNKDTTINQLMDYIEKPDFINSTNQAISNISVKLREDLLRNKEMSGYKLINDWITNWAKTSGDTEPIAIALQKAVREEFNLVGTSAHLVETSAVNKIYNKYGKAFRAFVREQYNLTQEFLKDRDFVTLYRGMNFESIDHIDFPFDGTVKSRVMSLQPISSFSTSQKTAKSFASISGDAYELMIQVEVPKERILSTCQTGFGCKNEAEMVVLGGTENMKSFATPSRIFEHLPHEEQDLISIFSKYGD